MPVHTGVADLPLHDGKVPPWIMKTMRKLSTAIVRVIVEERGPEAILTILSDPLWFQAFNNVIGMDWDSSGSTTVVLAVLKEISWKEDLGFLILGGKGKRMRDVPNEAEYAERKLGVPADLITRSSKAAARLDSSFLQDGYDLYIHGIAVSSSGRWVVVQQGMNVHRGIARRYHVVNDDFSSPHSAIAGLPGNIILDATAESSAAARKVYLDIIGEGPKRFERLLREASSSVATGGLSRYFDIPASNSSKRHAAKAYYKPVMPTKRLLAVVEELSNMGLAGDRDLLLAPGVGPRLVRALALIADIIYGVPTSTTDPVTHPLDPFLYAYAVGGKDGIPYPFDMRTALEAYRFLEQALDSARLDSSLKLKVMRRLHKKLRSLATSER